MSELIRRIRNTPLKFHNAYVGFLLPIVTVSNFINIIQLVIMRKTAVSNLEILALIEGSVFIILGFLSIKYLALFKRIGFVFLMVLQSLTVLDSLIGSFLMFKMGQYSLIFAFIIRCALSGLIIIYYAKRRDLFTKDGISIEERNAILTNTYIEPYDDELEREDEMAFEQFKEEKETPEVPKAENKIEKLVCPKCKKENSYDAVFCSRCGTQLRKVNS